MKEKEEVIDFAFIFEELMQDNIVLSHLGAGAVPECQSWSRGHNNAIFTFPLAYHPTISSLGETTFWSPRMLLKKSTSRET